MLIYVLRRAFYSIPVLLVATFLVFCMVSATFDPTARLQNSRNAAQARAEMREELGLDRPLLEQYGDWLVDAAAGDLGTTYTSLGREPVMDRVGPALWATVQLTFWGILISAVVAITVGVYSAVRQYSITDYVFTGLAFVGLALPPFWIGLLLYDLVIRTTEWNGGDAILFGSGLHSSGQSGFNLDYIRHLVLPVLTLTVQIIASWSRFQRAAMLDVLSSDYVRTARAKGVPRRRVIFKHGLRNALVPLVTIMALDIGALFGGLVITEEVFSIPGMGRLFSAAVDSGDAPLVLAWTLVASTFIILFNLLADLLYSALDPRVRVT